MIYNEPDVLLFERSDLKNALSQPREQEDEADWWKDPFASDIEFTPIDQICSYNYTGGMERVYRASLIGIKDHDGQIRITKNRLGPAETMVSQEQFDALRQEILAVLRERKRASDEAA